MRGKSRGYIAEAEKHGHSEDVCTYVKCDLGMLKAGNVGPTGTRLPKPDLLLLSYTGCYTFMKWFELLR
jgi:benzoyl-CoA reductase subunit B